MKGKNLSDDFSNAGINELPGFIYVDHIAIAVCKGEMENHVKMYSGRISTKNAFSVISQ